MVHGAILAAALSCLAPLFAGGLTPTGRLLIQVVGFAFAAIAMVTDRQTPRRVRSPALLILGIGAVGLIQWVPLPAAVVRMLSPASAESHAAAAAVLARAGARPPLPRITLAPEETAAMTLLVLAYAAILWAAASLPVRGIPEVFVAAGAIQLLASSFVIRNQDAAFLLMPLAIAAGTAIVSAGRVRRWSVVAALVFLGGIIATSSRGGMAAAAVTVLFLILWNGSSRTLIGTAVAGAAGATITAVLLGDPRLKLWHHALESWGSFPILGSGLGAFGDAFASTASGEAPVIAAHAHNDLLQIGVTGGILGMLFSLGAALFIASTPFKRTPLGLGAAGATVGLAIHGAVDFNLSLPAIIAAYLCLAGAAMNEALAGTARDEVPGSFESTEVASEERGSDSSEGAGVGARKLVEPIGIEPTTS